MSPIAKMALLFWVFSYVLFSSRVQLRGDEGLEALISLRRLAATGAGALLYAGVLRLLIFPARRKPAHPLVLVAAVIPAAAAMVAFRTIVDPLVASEPLPFGDHVRWVLVWSGYFGLWSIGFHAWRMYSERAQVKAPVEGAPEVLEKLVSAFAEEAARLSEAERAALLRRPDSGYPLSDDPLEHRPGAHRDHPEDCEPDRRLSDYSSVRISTVSPIRVNNTNGDQAARNGV